MAKYLRYEYADIARYGILEGSFVRPLKGGIGSFSASGDEPIALDQVRLLAPVVPSKIISSGPGYYATLMESGVQVPQNPIMFIKPATSLNHPEGLIELPSGLPGVYFEAELAIVIGKRAKGLSEEEALDCIFGYTCMNDVTAGNFDDMAAHMNSSLRVYGKMFDGFAPIGPFIVTDIDPGDLRIQCRVNGTTRQDHRTADRIFSLPKIVSWVSSVTTLFPGDVISTGSPPGVGKLSDGDVVEVEIEHLGILRNYARAREG